MRRAEGHHTRSAHIPGVRSVRSVHRSGGGTCVRGVACRYNAVVRACEKAGQYKLAFDIRMQEQQQQS